jgi:hypothetical protein
MKGLLPWGKAIKLHISVCVCVCVCYGRGGMITNQARKATPYFQLQSRWLHHTFRHYLINGMIFGKKKLFYVKCVF